jgi:hypothetical protein
MRRVLVVEDSDRKFDSIRAVVEATLKAPLELIRASTVVEAEKLVLQGPWSVAVLDMSMNITESTLGPDSGGHATLGGMGVAEKMYLLGAEVPTIVVTAFDAFQAKVPTNPVNSVVGLEYVESYARSILGEWFLGCVRYSDAGWAAKLSEILEGISNS